MPVFLCQGHKVTFDQTPPDPVQRLISGDSNHEPDTMATITHLLNLVLSGKTIFPTSLFSPQVKNQEGREVSVFWPFLRPFVHFSDYTEPLIP